nr:uncharacterized protein LOC116773577 [Danaus plexippus plexippus]
MPQAIPCGSLTRCEGAIFRQVPPQVVGYWDVLQPLCVGYVCLAHFTLTHVDNEGEELCHDANLPPEVDLPVEGTEPQSSPSGMSRHSKLNTSSANEKNFLPLVLILRFGRQES